MSSFPKSVESEVTRFFYTRQRDNKGKKNGGMVAVLKLPNTEWNDVQVYQPDTDGDQWWSLLNKGMNIRAAVREVANNKEDLIAFALPLKNQPSETQALIRQRMASEQQNLEIAQPDGDKLEEQLKAEVERKQHLETLKHYLPRLRYLIKKGEWLDNNDTGLLLAQSAICKAVCEWSEDYSSDADSTFTQNVMDACKYIIDAMVPLRGSLFDGEEPEGTLSVTCRHGQAKTVLDLKHLK